MLACEPERVSSTALDARNRHWKLDLGMSCIADVGSGGCEHEDSEYMVRVRAQVMERDKATELWLAARGNPWSVVGLLRRQRAAGESRGGDTVSEGGAADETEYVIHGKRLHSGQEVINCVVSADLQYSSASPTFHHWMAADGTSRYGLSFVNASDANRFEKHVRRAICHVDVPRDARTEEVFAEVALPIVTIEKRQLATKKGDRQTVAKGEQQLATLRHLQTACSLQQQTTPCAGPRTVPSTDNDAVEVWLRQGGSNRLGLRSGTAAVTSLGGAIQVAPTTVPQGVHRPAARTLRHPNETPADYRDPCQPRRSDMPEQRRPLACIQRDYRDRAQVIGQGKPAAVTSLSVSSSTLLLQHPSKTPSDIRCWCCSGNACRVTGDCGSCRSSWSGESSSGDVSGRAIQLPCATCIGCAVRRCTGDVGDEDNETLDIDDATIGTRLQTAAASRRRRRSALKWTLFAVLGLVLPCIWCYPPLAACHRAARRHRHSQSAYTTQPAQAVRDHQAQQTHHAGLSVAGPRGEGRSAC